MKPQTIIRAYNIFRLVVILASLISLIIFASKTQAQNIHGILRGKYEYQPEMEASRFEVRNARLSVDGSLKQVAAYKLEAQYFANRSFIAKQVGDMRDVGFQLGYDWTDDEGRKVVVLDAGVFNGSNLDNQKTAWFTSPSYSARLQWFPAKEWAIMPSIQHQKIAAS